MVSVAPLSTFKSTDRCAHFQTNQRTCKPHFDTTQFHQRHKFKRHTKGLSECDDVIKRARVSRSTGLPHRGVTDGLRRLPF